MTNHPKTGGEWDRHIETLDVKDITRYVEALEVLKDWKEFKAAFGWTLMFCLIPSLAYNKQKKGEENG
ncbi:MAG: hypothetical protein JRI72_00455 [Deltaproteobacteria bacterium]|nr:hypothetical protein [Deltaproteobacteria bacterium]